MSRLQNLTVATCLAAVAAAAWAETPPTRHWILLWEASSRLAHKDNAEAAAILQPWLADEQAHPWLRGRALVALTQLRGRDMLGQVERFSKDAKAVWRQAACEALRHLSPKDARPRLTKLLTDDDPLVRLHAAESLAAVDGADAWAAVKHALTRPNGPNLVVHVRTLARIGNDEAQERLRKLLQDAGTSRRQSTIVSALAVSDAGWAVQWLVDLATTSPEQDIRQAARSVLLRVRTETVAMPISEYLARADGEQLRHAVRLANDHPSRAVADALVALLRGDRVADLHAGDLALAMEVLEQLPDPDKLDVYRSYASRPDAATDDGKKDALSRRIRHLSMDAIVKATDDDARIFGALKPALDAGRSAERATRLIARHTAERPAEGFVDYFTPTVRQNPDLSYTLVSEIGRRLSAEERKQFIDLFMDLAEKDTYSQRTRDRLRYAARELAADEPWRLAQLDGYVGQWMVIAPFDNDPDNAGFCTVYPPERQVELDESYTGGEHRKASMDTEKLPRRGRRRDRRPLADEFARNPREVWDKRLRSDDRHEVGWEPMLTDAEGIVDLARVSMAPIAYRVGYAYAEISTDEKRNVALHFDFDNGGMVWLNGEQLGSVGEDDKHPVRDKQTRRHDDGKTFLKPPHVLVLKNVQLRPGVNRLLVKVTNLSNDWWMRCRVTVDGSPTDAVTFWDKPRRMSP